MVRVVRESQRDASLHAQAPSRRQVHMSNLIIWGNQFVTNDAKLQHSNYEEIIANNNEDAE